MMDASPSETDLHLFFGPQKYNYSMLFVADDFSDNVTILNVYK